MDSPETAAERVLLSVVLRPRRSAGLGAINLVTLAVAAVLGAAGCAFVAIGAWPVSGFLGAEVLLLYGALRLHHRAGNASETIDLTDRELVVVRVDPWGRRRRWRFPAHWLQVAVDPRSRPGNRLELRSHGRSLVVGAFLTPEERLALAAKLRDRLAGLARPGLPAAASG
jgi:uncharacterized membrane protein